MVSAGEAANLQKLCDEVKGLSLIEVVEKYGDADTTESPTYSYSPTMVSEFINYLGSTHGWADEIENNLEKLTAYCKSRDLRETHIESYIAYNLWDAFMSSCIELIAAQTFQKDNFVSWFFKVWAQNVPVAYIIPVLFPTSNTLSITVSNRYRLIEELFRRLKNRDKFYSLINQYAEDNPFFRNYPAQRAAWKQAPKEVVEIKKEEVLDESEERKPDWSPPEHVLDEPKTYEIRSPRRAYFHRSFKLSWNYEVGQTVPKGACLLELIDPNEVIKINASENWTLIKTSLHSGASISKSDTALCSVKVANHLFQTNDEKGPTSQILTEKNLILQPSAKSIEERLLKLKELHSKDLISNSNFEDKQADILKEL